MVDSLAAALKVLNFVKAGDSLRLAESKAGWRQKRDLQGQAAEIWLKARGIYFDRIKPSRRGGW